MIKYILCLAILTATAFAEDPARGRLPDGRAFRTDTAGNQLVDYIAELEVEVESLKRQVVGLEDENTGKQATIERLQSGREVNPQVTERDLTKGASGTQPTGKCEPKVIEKIVEKVVEKPSACLPSGSTAELTEVKQQLALAKQDLEQKQIDIDILNSKLEKIPQSGSKVVSSGGFITNNADKNKSKDARYRAVDMLRKSMMQDLKKLEDLAIYRDKLYAKVNKSKFAEPAKVNTAEYKAKLASSEQVQEMANVRTRINETRGKVQQEIALYKRVLKIR